MHGNIQCARCGDSEESINYVFFECPPAVQVWALSKVPSNPLTFPSPATNLDYLYWRASPYMDDHQFAWILWYIWKGRNNKVFSNIDVDPRDTLKLAGTESLLWEEAQASVKDGAPNVQQMEATNLPFISGRWCFTDGSWKAHHLFFGTGLV